MCTNVGVQNAKGIRLLHREGLQRSFGSEISKISAEGRGFKGHAGHPCVTGTCSTGIFPIQTVSLHEKQDQHTNAKSDSRQ